MPGDLAARYTMDGLVGVEDWYENDTLPAGEETIFRWRKIRSKLRKIRKRKTAYYGPTDTWLYEALRKYPIWGKHAVNMGCTTPWYESVLLHYGALRVTTVEYNRTVFRHPRIRAVTPAWLEAHPRRFAVGTSISTFEHDGLGRYGDPLDPDADLAAMARMKTILRPGGLLFLSVPVGKDKVVWNVHRVYGKHRLPLLMQGWELVEFFGDSDPAVLERDTGIAANYQPIFVLRNPAG
jgi:SAM-dependent methyltransferase